MAQPQIWRLGSMMDVFPEFRRLRRDMNRLLAEAPYWAATPFAADFPAINVWVGQEDAVVTAEIPGIDPQQLELSIVGNVLKICGARAEEGTPARENYYRQERSCGTFSRTLQLPFPVDTAKVEAKYEKGILEIIFPRAEAEKPRKIALKKD